MGVDSAVSGTEGTHPRFLDKGARGRAVGEVPRWEGLPMFSGGLSGRDFDVDGPNFECVENGLDSPGTASLNVNGNGIEDRGR